MALNYEVELYKKNRVSELMSKYNKYKSIYDNNYNLARNKIIKSNDTTEVKKLKINNLNSQYTSAIAKIKADHNNSVSKINSFKVDPINIQPRNNRRALLVGINDYEGENSDIPGCVIDVSNVKEKLLTLGYTDNNIKTLLDKEATGRNIADSLINLLTTSVSGDLIFFLFSGHGGTYVDKNNDEYNTKDDEIIFGADLVYISDDILKSIIAKNLKPNVTLFALFDSCNSGSVLDLRYQYIDTINNNNYIENMKASETKGNVIMIAGCSDTQTSETANINNIYQGAMTWSFLKSLNDASDDITWRKLIVNMRNNLNGDFKQMPQISSGKIMELDAKCFI